MPNIRSQSITDEAVTVVTSSGVVWTVTFAEILAYYRDVATGTPPQRKQQTIDHFRDSLYAASPAELTGCLAELGIDDVTGKVDVLTIMNGVS